MNLDRAYDQSKEAQWAVRVLENILRPIVRMLFGKRIGFETVVAVIRRLYVEQAYQFAATKNPFKQPTVSSISVSSGVDVKDVKAELDSIRLGLEEDLAWLKTGCAETKILDHWAHQPPFVDSSGSPVELGGFGPGLTFERLVKRVCGNVGPAEIRDRLYQAGCIDIINHSASGDYSLKLINRVYTSTSDQERSIMEFASAALRHIATTLTNNVQATDPGGAMLQQERWTRRLRREDAAEFRKRTSEWVRGRISESEELIESYEKDPFARDEHIHAGVGFYYFEEDPAVRTNFSFQRKTRDQRI